MNTVNDDKDFSEQHMLYTEPVEGGCFVEKFEDSEAESDQEELEEDRNTSEISEQDNNETNDIDEEE
jgi:hypothetical protein